MSFLFREYAFTDYIYGQTLESDLNKKFIRIRQYQKTSY